MELDTPIPGHRVAGAAVVLAERRPAHPVDGVVIIPHRGGALPGAGPSSAVCAAGGGRAPRPPRRVATSSTSPEGSVERVGGAAAAFFAVRGVCAVIAHKSVSLSLLPGPRRQWPAGGVAALDVGAAAMAALDAVRTLLVLLDLRVVRRAQAAQVVESIVRRRLDTSRARVDVVDMRRAAAAARHGAAAAVTPQRFRAQLLPVLGRVITVSRQMPLTETMGPETRHERANRICVEAILIARRDGPTAEERFRIYEREIARLTEEEPTVPGAPYSA